MTTSIFDIFKIGIGPSSSHTVGPMIISNLFMDLIQEKNYLEKLSKIKIDFFGSLAATGVGHGSDKATLLGLLGETPKTVDTNSVDKIVEDIKEYKKINLLYKKVINFDYEKDLTLHKSTFLPYHPNAVTLSIYDESDTLLLEKTYYSIGGGFVIGEEDINKKEEKKKEVK